MRIRATLCALAAVCVVVQVSKPYLEPMFMD